jgi:hypothetical protein
MRSISKYINIKSLKRGSWYYMVSTYDYHWLFQADGYIALQHNGNCVDPISGRYFETSNTICNLSDVVFIRYANDSEIKKYFPNV